MLTGQALSAGSEPAARVVEVGGIPMSALVAEVQRPRAVVVALHGGGATPAYFDAPAHPRLSLLRAGAALGFTVIALERPGYGSGCWPSPKNPSTWRAESGLGPVEGSPADRLGTSPARPARGNVLVQASADGPATCT
jgi:hypothetical protein